MDGLLPGKHQPHTAQLRGIPKQVIRFSAARLSLNSVSCLCHSRPFSLSEKSVFSRIIAVSANERRW